MDIFEKAAAAHKLWMDQNGMLMHDQTQQIAAALEFFEPGSISGHYFDEAAQMVSERVLLELQDRVADAPETPLKEIVDGYPHDAAECDVFSRDGRALIERFSASLDEDVALRLEQAKQ